MAYESETALESHLQISHDEVYRFRCPLCTRPFKDNWHMQRHIKIHEKESSIQCQKCLRMFNRQSTLTRHMQAGTCRPFHSVEEGREECEEDCRSDLCTEKPAAPEVTLPVKRRSEMEDMEWYESSPPKAVPKPVRTPENYFCRLCGETMPRETLSQHLAEHSAELYQTLPQDSAKVTFTRTHSGLSAKPVGTCLHCGLDSSVIDKIRRALKSLSEGYSTDIIV